MATIIRRAGCVVCAVGLLFWAGWQVVHAHKQEESTSASVNQQVLPVAYSPTLDRSTNWLSLGLHHLENGSLQDAEFCLCEHVRDHPKHLRARALYADLLVKRRLFTLAEEQYGKCIALEQDRPNRSLQEEIFWRQRLMQIAQIHGDTYSIHLHKGIGLYLLSRQQFEKNHDDLEREQLLFGAIRELEWAHLIRPNRAKPCLYLHLSWKTLGQSLLSNRNLQLARDNAVTGGLTPAEQRHTVSFTVEDFLK